MAMVAIEDGGTEATYIFGPFFWGYVRGYPHKIWPEKWYSTSI